MIYKVLKYLNFLKDSICSIIYEDRCECVICKQYEENKICSVCKSKISFAKGSFFINKEGYRLKCYSVAYYSGTTVELILRLKYKSDFTCGEILAKYLADKIKKENIKVHFLTFVPMTKKDFKRRGYNQSKFLAKRVGYILEIPVIKSLIKIKKTKDQIGLNGEERWNNVNNSFKCVNKHKIIDKNIILIDDVITTGATAFACAKELVKCKANKINILTVAKSVV